MGVRNVHSTGGKRAYALVSDLSSHNTSRLYSDIDEDVHDSSDKLIELTNTKTGSHDKRNDKNATSGSIVYNALQTEYTDSMDEPC